MLNLYVPFNDVTEIGNMRYMTAEILAADEKLIKTPLAFAHYGDRGDSSKGYKEVLTACGWTEVTSGLNWHNWHNGDANLPVWMKLFPENKADKKHITGNKVSMYPEHGSFAYGCGGRLINGFKDFQFEKMLVANSAHWYKFTTIIRIHGGMKNKASRVAWLEAMHFRELPEFATSEAKYWVNGWKPAEWPGYALERKFWTTFKMPKPLDSPAK